MSAKAGLVGHLCVPDHDVAWQHQPDSNPHYSPDQMAFSNSLDLPEEAITSDHSVTAPLPWESRAAGRSRRDGTQWILRFTCLREHCTASDCWVFTISHEDNGVRWIVLEPDSVSAQDTESGTVVVLSTDFPETRPYWCATTAVKNKVSQTKDYEKDVCRTEPDFPLQGLTVNCVDLKHTTENSNVSQEVIPSKVRQVQQLIRMFYN